MKTKCRNCGGELEKDSPEHAYINRYKCKKCGKTNYDIPPTGLGEKYIRDSKTELKKRGIKFDEKKKEDEE